jgi:hypothetical protein
MTRDPLNDPGRHRPLTFHVISNGLTWLGLGENERGGTGIEIAFSKDMPAVAA